MEVDGIDSMMNFIRYRFVEIYYHRPKSTHKGKQIPARVETVVVYVPDVWSVMPSCLEWDELQCSMKKQMDSKLSVETDRDQAEVAADDEKASDYFFYIF